MTQLQRGQNQPWPHDILTAYVGGADVTALLVGPDGRAVDAEAWLDGTRTTRHGVELLGAATPGVRASLDAVPAYVAKVLVLASGFSVPPTVQLHGPRPDAVLSFATTGLSTERAVVMVEVYRRAGAWKVRAVGQGYAGGLPELAAAYGATLPGPTPAPSSAPPSAPPPSTGVADPVVRLGMILEDASRTTASVESSTQYAGHRLESDLEVIVGDPSLRSGPRGDAARAEAQQRHDRLVADARARHEADLAQLGAEIDELELSLPPALSRWAAAGWASGPSGSPGFAVRVGDLGLEAAPDFRLPMVRALPLQPPVWVETEGSELVAGRMLRALCLRLLVALPSVPRLSVVDVGGRSGLADLPGAAPVATDPASAARVIQEHLEHVSLVSMAASAGTWEDLAPEHRPGRVLVVADFPGGLDEASAVAVLTLVTAGPAYGLNVLLSGSASPSLGLPVLEQVHTSCLRVPSASGGDLVDRHGGVSWTFHPDLGPDDPVVLERVRATISRRVGEQQHP